MKLSIIIVSYNVRNLIKECLVRLKKSGDNIEKEIILIDNNSSDGTGDMLKKDFPEIRLILNQKNLGYGKANNLAYTKTKGKYILLLNPDTFVSEDTIQKTVDFMEQNSQCGILGCRLVGVDGRPQRSGRYFPTPWRLFLLYSGFGDKPFYCTFFRRVNNLGYDWDSIVEIDWVPACYFLIRRKMIDEIGFFDDIYYMYYEDVDLCLKAKKNGWKVLYYPATSVVHLGGESAKKVGKITLVGKQLENLALQSEFIYFRKNHGIIYVLFDFLFILLFDFIEILKKIIKRKKQIKIFDKINHIKKAYNIMLATKFGKT